MAAHSGTALMPSVLAILAWSRRDPRAAVLLVLCSGVIASGNIVLALAIAQAMEAFTTTAALAQATWPLVVLIAAGSVRGLVGLLRGMMLRRLRYRVIREQDDALVSGLLVGARNSGEGASPGAAARALAAGDRAGELLFGDVTSALAELAVAPVIVAILWHFHPAMALVGVLVAVLNLLLIRRFVSIDGQLGQTRATAQQRVAGLLESDLRSIETIRMTRTEPEVARGWQNAVVAEFDVLRHAGKFGEAIAASQTALAMLMGGIALGVGGGLMVLSPGFGFEAFIASQTLLFALGDPVRRLVASHAECQRTTADLMLRQGLIDSSGEQREGPPQEATVPDPVLIIAGNAATDTVRIRPGEVAIIERSNQQALLGREVPALEAVGRVREVHAPALMLPGSLAQNISLFDEAVTTDDLERVMDLAQLSEVLDDSTERFERTITAGIEVFSHGQLYRLSVARALLDQPDFIVLTGALGSLDPECQTRLVRGLAQAGIGVLATSASTAINKTADIIVVGGRRS